jgi:hypothetical protein
MATKLTKPVSRELDRPILNRRIIVTIEPGNIISFREAGKRGKLVETSLNIVMVNAMKENK